MKGFGVCVDGFGDGHVGDGALGRIPLTEVALAPALVSGAAHDPARAAALEDALESTRALGLPAVARGCDDADDYELLLQIGCSHAQGDFIARALPADELVQLGARVERAVDHRALGVSRAAQRHAPSLRRLLAVLLALLGMLVAALIVVTTLQLRVAVARPTPRTAAPSRSCSPTACARARTT